MKNNLKEGLNIKDIYKLDSYLEYYQNNGNLNILSLSAFDPSGNKLYSSKNISEYNSPYQFLVGSKYVSIPERNIDNIEINESSKYLEIDISIDNGVKYYINLNILSYDNGTNFISDYNNFKESVIYKGEKVLETIIIKKEVKIPFNDEIIILEKGDKIQILSEINWKNYPEEVVNAYSFLQGNSKFNKYIKDWKRGIISPRTEDFMATMISLNFPDEIASAVGAMGVKDFDYYTLAKLIIEDNNISLTEASRRTLSKPYDFGNGLSLISYGMSPNGNHTVTVELPSGKTKSIQTNNPELSITHSYLKGAFKDIDPKDLEKIGKELNTWIKNYESKQKKEMMISNSQSKKWNNEAILFLKQNEDNWVTAGFDYNDNTIQIWPYRLPNDLDESEYDDVGEFKGSELLDFVGQAQFMMMESKKKNEAEKWSGDVETKWDAPEGTFTKSASEVAKIVLDGHKGDIGASIKSINFYINRAGDNLDSKQKKELEKAIEILQSKEK